MKQQKLTNKKTWVVRERFIVINEVYPLYEEYVDYRDHNWTSVYHAKRNRCFDWLKSQITKKEWNNLKTIEDLIKAANEVQEVCDYGEAFYLVRVIE